MEDSDDECIFTYKPSIEKEKNQIQESILSNYPSNPSEIPQTFKRKREEEKHESDEEFIIRTRGIRKFVYDKYEFLTGRLKFDRKNNLRPDKINPEQKILNEIDTRMNSFIMVRDWRKELLDKGDYFLPEEKWKEILEDEKQRYNIYGDQR